MEMQLSGFPGGDMELRPVEYQGHGENTGGLQMHSIGDTYPFMVVGTMHRRMDQQSDHTRYYVLNAVTGDKYYRKQDSGEITTWFNSRLAHRIAEALADGGMVEVRAIHENAGLPIDSVVKI